ncbi:MaoC/PaaZ C-terminal domain-containing protein [Mycolicibacterium sp. XJ879]
MTAAVRWDDLKVGAEGEPFSEPALRITDFVRYQGASGDMNPIHHDTEFAKRAGYPGPFAVGMRQAGVLAAWVTDWFGARNVRRFGVRFREQAWPGDILTYTGRVTEKRIIDSVRQADLELSCTRQTGGIHLVGWATVIIP